MCIRDRATGLLCVGSGARELVEEAFQGEWDESYENGAIIRLPGMVSRKKQLIPKIIAAAGAL